MTAKWKYPETRGAPVTVYEREPGGLLYARAWTGGKYIVTGLGHRDRDKATVYALAEGKKLREGQAALTDGRLPVSKLFALYLAHHSPSKSLGEQKEDQRRAKLWARFLGDFKDANKVTVEEWRRFSRERASGVLAGDGFRPETPRPVRARAVQRDLQWLKWCLKWATEWQDADGVYLMASNPVRGKQAFPIPSEKNVNRPVASTDRVEAVVAAAHPDLADFMVVLSETGRRLSAVLRLQWADVLWNQGPHGSIRWPADPDKEKRRWGAPLSPAARAALERLKDRRSSIGLTYIFPSPTNKDRPMTPERVRTWLLKAEERAGLEKQKGSLFHAYRRGWATARKHFPDRDVATAGGWKGTETLRMCYQQPDEEMLYAVVTGGRELREAK